MKKNENQNPPLTFKLNDGSEVIAKASRDFPDGYPVTYANRTQAYRAADKLGKGWEVREPNGMGRAFYVRKVEIMRYFAHTCAEFQAEMHAIAEEGGNSVEFVYGVWREYCAAASDQSNIVSEFRVWYAERLGLRKEAA